MSAIPKTYITEQEYLETERKAEFKSEYYKGEVFAMAGATKEHNKIVASIIGSLYGPLKGKLCSVMPSDIRVLNSDSGLYSYPDVVVTCEEEKYLDEQFDTLLNPTIIFEVLSKSTESYDRGVKFKLYRTLPSLKHYVVISSTEISADVYTRKGTDWIVSIASSRGESLYLSAIDYKLLMEDVYAQVPQLQ